MINEKKVEWYRKDRKEHPEKYREYMREWRNKNKNKVKEINRKAENKLSRKLYKRQHSLIVNGKRIRVDKRPFSGYCELCKRTIERRPQWHHWDDNEPNKGIWLCRKCHFDVEEYEHVITNKRTIEIYLKKKSEING